MTLSRMAALASSSLWEGGGRCTGLRLRKAFQAKWRVRVERRERGGVMRGMDITLRMDVCMHKIRTENGQKKDENKFDREEQEILKPWLPQS